MGDIGEVIEGDDVCTVCGEGVTPGGGTPSAVSQLGTALRIDIFLDCRSLRDAGDRASSSSGDAWDDGGEVGTEDGIERTGGTGFTDGGRGGSEPNDRTDATKGVVGALAVPTLRPRESWSIRSSFERFSFEIMRCSRLPLLADLVVGVRDTELTVAVRAG